VNPRTGQASSVIGDNNFATLVDQVVEGDMTSPNDDVESAIALVQESGGDTTGMAIAPLFRSALAQQKDAQGLPMFPDLAWGNAPSSINGLSTQVNRNVSDMAANNERAILGDFTGSFKWGYAKQIPLEVIQYGDPDNSGLDLKGYNQVYLRAEV